MNEGRILCSTSCGTEPYPGRVCAPSILLNTWQNLPYLRAVSAPAPQGAATLSHYMAPTSPYALILDDHPLVAHGMAEFLRARLPQMEVVEAAGADDLLRWVEMRGTPAIALIDFWLAEGAAVGLIAQVRSHCPGMPIAVISGDDDPAVMEQARQAGAQGFIHKQAAPETFGLAVEALLSGLVWFEPGLLGSQRQTTNDAFVAADFTLVAPRVAGFIKEVLVEDNQHVAKGDLLVRLEGNDFQFAVERARATLAITIIRFSIYNTCFIYCCQISPTLFYIFTTFHHNWL